jgi:hypothetical protein
MQSNTVKPQPDWPAEDSTFGFYKAEPTIIAGLLLTLLFSAFALAPMLYPGYLQVHSGFLPFWNLSDLRQEFGKLNWIPGDILPFDVFRQEGLTAYYTAFLLPVSDIRAIKMIFGLGFLLGASGVYFWLRSWFGNIGALVSALIYIYSPFFLTTVYVRGAWAETLFWGMLPWAVLGATYLVSTPRLLLIPFAAVFWAILGFTQLGLTIWATLLITLMVLVVHFRQALFPVLAMVMGTGVAVLGYWWLSPSGFSLSRSPDPTEHLLYPFQLFSSFWGAGVSQAGWNDGLSLQVGIAGLGLAIVALFLWQRSADRASNPASGTDRRMVFFPIAVVVICLLMVGLVSGKWLWGLLTYPWQLLGFVGLFLAVLGGAVPWIEPKFQQLPLFAGLVLVVIIPVYPHLTPQYVNNSEITAPQALVGTPDISLLEHNFTTVVDGHTVGLASGQAMVPLTVHGALSAGDELQLNVSWHPLRSMAKDYKIFVHLVDPAGNILAQFDGQPQAGLYPTSQWIPGEIIGDTYPVVMPQLEAQKPYQVYIGFYDSETLERLPVVGDGAGRIILDVP